MIAIEGGIDYSAKIMHYYAENLKRLPVSHTFKNPATCKLVFFAARNSSRTLHERVLGNRIILSEWMIECYSEFAGTVYFEKNSRGKKVNREKNSIHLYAPGCCFREDARIAALPLRETSIRFKGGEVCGLDRLVDEKLKYCRFLDPERKIISLMEEATEVCSRRGDAAFWEIQSIFMGCIDLMLNSSEKIGRLAYRIIDKEQSSDEEFVRKAEEFMRQNIDRKCTNSDIAAHMNTSKSTFCHKFKRAAGISPTARMLEMKIEVAKNLLFKGVKMKVIATETGFRDEFYLSRIFKKITGVSPRDFRIGKTGRN